MKNKQKFPFLFLGILLLVSSFYSYSCYVHHLYMNQQYSMISRLPDQNHLSYFVPSTKEEIQKGKDILSSYKNSETMKNIISNYISTPIIPFVLFSGGGILLVYFILKERQNSREKHFKYLIEQMENGHYQLQNRDDPFEEKLNQLYLYILQLEEQNQITKDNSRKFIEDVAHQIKTPLTSVKLYTENSTDQFAKDSLEDVNRMEDMITNLIRLSKMESHTLKYSFEYNSIQDTMENIMNSLSYLIKEKKIELQLDIDDIYFYYDDLWLGEAITNILKNSIEYSMEEGIIQVSIKEYDSRICFKITDYGLPISNENISHLFDRFYSTKNNDRKQNGMGIGLNIAKEVVLAHKGLIYVNNQQGVTFTIDLPNIQLKEKI